MSAPVFDEEMPLDEQTITSRPALPVAKQIFIDYFDAGEIRFLTEQITRTANLAGLTVSEDAVGSIVTLASAYVRRLPDDEFTTKIKSLYEERLGLFENSGYAPQTESKLGTLVNSIKHGFQESRALLRQAIALYSNDRNNVDLLTLCYKASEDYFTHLARLNRLGRGLRMDPSHALNNLRTVIHQTTQNLKILSEDNSDKVYSGIAFLQCQCELIYGAMLTRERRDRKVDLGNLMAYIANIYSTNHSDIQLQLDLESSEILPGQNVFLIYEPQIVADLYECWIEIMFNFYKYKGVEGTFKIMKTNLHTGSGRGIPGIEISLQQNNEPTKERFFRSSKKGLPAIRERFFTVSYDDATRTTRLAFPGEVMIEG